MNLKELQQEQEKKQREIKKEIRIRREFLKVGIEANHVLSPSDKCPTVTIKAKDKTDFIKILKTLKKEAIPIYYFHYGTSGFYTLQELKNKYSDRVVWDGVNKDTEHKLIEIKDGIVKESDDLFLLKSPFIVDVENSRYGNKDINIRFETKKYSVWVEGDLSFYNPSIIDSIDEIDPYETEQARKYKHNHEAITKRNYYFKDVEKIDYYGGQKTHYCRKGDIKKFESLVFRCGDGGY